MKNLTKLALGMAFAAAASSASATVLYTTNFETDQTSSFTVVGSSADIVANFAFDYALFTQTAPTAGVTSIPAAPSGAGTKGLKLAANVDGTGTVEAVSAFINAGAGKTTYTLTFDAYQLYNGPADATGTGTTTFAAFGDAAGTAAVYSTAAALSGFYVGLSCEGGTTNDVVYYEGNGAAPTLNNAAANWGGTAAASEEVAPWTTLFTTPTYGRAGAPGRNWVTWKLEVVPGTTTVSVKPAGASSFTTVSTLTPTAGIPTNGKPFVGYYDPFASLPVPTSDNFVIIDNLTLDEPAPPTAAGSWSLYN